jgi:DUF1009 family protein
MLPIIGIIAGNGLLPFSIADNYIKQGGSCYIAALDGEADLELVQNFNYKIFKIGMAGAVIEYFKKHNVENVIFAGGINRPDLRSIKVDKVGSILLLEILKQKIWGQKILGDDKALQVIINFFEKKGFKVISSNEIYKNQAFDTEVVTTCSPPFSYIEDIELGIKLLKNLSEFDVGQALIIKDRYVLGIEAAEGTDNLIIRCAPLRKKTSGGVLVKIMKLGQDSRVDIPTIGPSTILNLAKYHYKGLAIEENKVIILHPALTLKLANKHKMFIIRKKC